ncbi:hypothetical protein chiPu_0008520 [Chiloscyllium punctatum]|uniref:Uncharacterized protein n=1 Tax=Chiloscyllium punctatum TaxID=137246 RepID=A0A401SI29_CHIPU|nr:hypothetical protein [Chiloscyllium punctatum]
MAEDNALCLDINAVEGEDQGGVYPGCEDVRDGEGCPPDVLESNADHMGGEIPVLEIGAHVRCSGMEFLLQGAETVKPEELGISVRIFTDGRDEWEEE